MNYRSTVIRWIARIWGLGILCSLFLFAWTALNWGDEEPVPRFVKDTIWVLGVMGLGTTISWKNELIGASIILLGFALSAVLKFSVYDPSNGSGSLLYFLILAIAGFLHGLAWLLDRRRKDVTPLRNTLIS